ncbi:MAG: BTAD domain-containing putative transcriptional regulator [Ilumatobacteraceae bacterium]
MSNGGLCVLGSIAVHVDGAAVHIGGEKPRRLLAMLVLHRNSVVSSDGLAHVVWGDDVPETGVSTLQTYVSRLRRVLPGSVRVIGQAPGYRLQVEPEALDADRFEARLAAGLDELQHAPALALEHLDQALAEWRGEAFAEFADEWWARAEAARLTELRLLANDARLDALLALGRESEAAGEAEALTVDHPWRELPWRALLIALHRMGRQAEALQKANDYRRRLRDDLGLDPSADFVELERDIALGAPLRPTSTVLVSPAADTAQPSRDVPPEPPTPQRAEGHDLIGRDADLATLVGLCRTRRLVTLVGPGGIGKTRLSLAASAELVRTMPIRCEVVELAPVRDAASAVAAVATQLQVQPQQGRSVTESIFDVLGQRSLLLVLDNCEHVLDTIARFTEQLLRLCPSVRVLATSREPLALPVETVFKVQALPVAAAGSAVADQAASPAVVLFVQRARSANPELPVGDASIGAVAELCRRLDGVPLAIELAAARTRSLSPTEITERLADRFDLLSGSSRVSDERHRSLRDLVDWSYQLLEPTEQLLFRRLSIFAGSFDLEAAEQVCGYGEVPRNALASVLAVLVDKSMVQASPGARTTYRMLETLREFGAVRDRDEAAEVARRHAAWILDICRRAAVGLHGIDERMWLDRLDALFDDVRLAVRNALDADDVSTALGIVVSAREHAIRRLRYELIGWAETAAARVAAGQHPLLPAALGLVAYGRFVRGEMDAAIEIGERAAELAETFRADAIGLPHRALGNAYLFAKSTPKMAPALARLVDDAVGSGDDARIAHACYMRSLSETRAAGAEAGSMWAEYADQAARRCGNPTALAQALYAQGIWSATTDSVAARALLLESERVAREAGNTWFILFARTENLWLQGLEGDPQVAVREFADVVSEWHRAGDWANLWLALRHVFGLCFLVHADELAAIIFGALERAGAVDAFPFEPSAAAQLEAMLEELRERLGENGFAAAELHGRIRSTSAVIELIVTRLRELPRA